MNNKLVKVNFRDIEELEFPIGTTFENISKRFQQHFTFPILIARVDNDLTELSDTITRKCNVEFYDRSGYVGNTVYGRTLQFIVIIAVKRALGKSVNIIIEHSIDKGFYCEVSKEITKKDINLIKEKMEEIVKEELTVQKISVLRCDAIKYFKKEKQEDKVSALKYISNTYVNLYSLDNIYDYFYGDLAVNTKTINDFKLEFLNEHGFVVNFPDVYNPEVTLDYVHHKKLFEKFYEYNDWCKSQNVKNASDLNEVVSTGNVADLIRISEAHYNIQLEYIAENISKQSKLPKIILIAGPTSSGKTTTSRKLEMYLKLKGIKTFSLSTDNYFLDRVDVPKDEKGNLDIESLYAIDITLFNKHLNKLLEGEKISMPKYDFVSGKKYYDGTETKLDDRTVIIIEGLHSLNDELTMSIERKYKYKIYISPLTQLNIDDHNRIHTSDTRKLRRIIRDNRTRGYNAKETLGMWKKIREGEEKWIFPFQDDVDIIINSALIYELGVLKTYVEPLLFSVSETESVYPEALRLINFLRNFLPIPSEDVPLDSVLREFIGNSCYK